MAAPKGNKFAAGHGWGRPPLYETPEAMIKVAEEYFEMETNTQGVCKPTISGLVFHLGFANRQSWYDYKERSKDFSYTIERLQKFIEACYEKNLHGFAWAGSVFALKNINSKDWKDEQTHNNINQTINADFGQPVQPPSEPTEDTRLD